MEFLKKQNLFSFLYDGKSIWNCEVQKMVSENENEIITELTLSDGLKVTNIAKKHSGNAYEWVNWFENTGSEPTKILSDIWDCDYVVPFEKDEKKIKISKLGYLPFLYSELYHFLRNLIKK